MELREPEHLQKSEPERFETVKYGYIVDGVFQLPKTSEKEFQKH